MSEPGDPGYRDMLEHQTGTEVPEEDLDPYEQEILDLGPPPGAGASANECDAYNFAVQEIKNRQSQEALEERRAIEDGTADDDVEAVEPVYIDAHTNEVVTGEKP
jgi:hypothetical protein